MTPDQKKIARLAAALFYVGVKDKSATITLGQLEEVHELLGLDRKDWPYLPFRNHENMQRLLLEVIESLKDDKLPCT